MDQTAQERDQRARLSCRIFTANAVRLQLHALAYNLGKLLRTLAMPKIAEAWSMTSLREKLIKIARRWLAAGAMYLSDGRGRGIVFADILSLIAQLLAAPAPA